MSSNANCDVTQAIESHLAAVHVDEASFDAEGKAVDAGLAEQTGAAEHSAFAAFVAVPCRSADDVQAKLRHLLDGSIGERNRHIDCLFDYGDDLLEKFLRSLVTEGDDATDAGSTLLNALPPSPHAPDLDRALISEIAMDIGKATVEHIETMYPAALEAVPDTARLSIRNTVCNEILSALKTVDADEIRKRLDERKAARRKALALYRGLRREKA